MMMLDHVLLGGLAGEFIESSPLAFTFSMLVHPLLDKIPHYFPEQKTKQAIVIALDLTSSILVLSLFWFGPFPKSTFWGGFGGILIDLILVNSPLAINSPLGQWHLKRQIHKTELIHVWWDVAIISFCVLAFSAFLYYK